MARKITKKVKTNDLLEDWHHPLINEKGNQLKEITITIENSGTCSKDCQFLSSCLDITYGCDLCNEEVGPSRRRYHLCKKIFGD